MQKLGGTKALVSLLEKMLGGTRLPVSPFPQVLRPWAGVKFHETLFSEILAVGVKPKARFKLMTSFHIFFFQNTVGYGL